MPTTIHHHTLTANGIRQHYLEAGNGAPVVLLHGFPETNFAWRFQIPALADQYAGSSSSTRCPTCPRR